MKSKSKKWKPALALSTFVLPLLLLFIASDIPATQNRKIYSAQLNPEHYSKQMQIIQAQGLDVAGIDFDQKSVQLILNPNELKKIKSMLPRIEFQQELTPIGIASIDTRYKTSEEVESLLKAYAQSYPTISQLVEVGKSPQGRSIWAIKITSSLKPSSDKPKILFNGMHHARELMSVEAPLDIIEQLLTGYAHEAKVKKWVDQNEIWVLPMLNVDGNHLVWTKDNMWRKNADGVDINRNYPYQWGKCRGSSGWGAAADYRGPSPASEGETQIMMNLVSNIRPVFDLSFHSFSELVLYPEGCKGRRAMTKEVVEKIGKEMADLIPKDDFPEKNYKAGTAWETLYAVDGDDIDWMYNEFGVIPYVIELNSKWLGFQPDYKWRDPTVQKIRPAWQLLLDRLDQSGLRGNVFDATTRRSVSNVEIYIDRPVGFPQIEKSNADGVFHVILNPGTYKVEFRAPGYQSTSKTIEIKSDRENFSVSLQKSQS